MVTYTANRTGSLNASGELSEQAETLRLKVESFLTAVKAA